ncbi:MAG: hypothetical protein GXO65_02260 [Euryarchaeota archaeon]|nr:hypothetical protein [Euryarchaeota archaeon]
MRWIVILAVLLVLPGAHAATSADFFVVDVSPTALTPGETVTMNITLKNLGREFGLYLRSQLDPNDLSPVTAVGSPKKFLSRAEAAEDTGEYFGIVRQDEELRIQYEVHVDDDASVGAYSIPLVLTWEDKLLNTQTQTLYLGVEIVGEPELVISGVSLDPARIYADSDFTLTLAIDNIGEDKAEVVECGLVFPEVFSGEDTAFLGTIARDGRATASYSLKASKEAESRSYDFTAVITYEDASGLKRVERPFRVFVSERGDIDLEIAGISTSPAKIYPGTDFTLSVQLENIGTQDAKSVMATISNSEGFVGEFSSFIGKIEVDDVSSGIFDLTATPSVTPGDHTFTMEILYTDEKGDEFTDTKTFTVYVDATPEKSKLRVVAGILVVAGAAVFLWRRRRAVSEIEG